MQHRLEVGLPMVTRPKVKPTAAGYTTTYKSLSEPAYISESKGSLKSMDIPDYILKIDVSETKLVVMKVEPPKGIFKSRVVPGKQRS